MSKDKEKNHDFNVVIGAMIRELRMAKGYTLYNVASHLGVSYQQVQKYEVGINSMNIFTFISIMKYLGVNTPEKIAHYTILLPMEEFQVK